jgi:RNA polymerase primary sigma factor
MVPVSQDIKDSERISLKSEESNVSDEESWEESEFPDVEISAQKPKIDSVEDSLNLYFAEVGQTPLLNEDETKLLTSQLEEGKYLAGLEKDWIAQYGTQASAMDLLLELAERLSEARVLFEAVCKYLKVPSRGSIAEKLAHSGLRDAIDSNIDEHLFKEVAEISGIAESRIENSIIELSLNSRLMPWHLIKEAGQKSSLAEFLKMMQSPEFRDKLEVHRPKIIKHFKQIRERAHQATQYMIQANLRLVVGVAKGHMGWNVPLPDLIQEGNIGLMQAVQKFDHRRGCKFSTYAVPWIWQAINRAVNDKSRIVRLPGHVVDDLTKLARTRNSLAQKLGRQPTEKELAFGLGLPSKKVESLLKMTSSGPVSLDTPLGEDGGQLGDLIADQAVQQPEEQAAISLLREELSKLLESLTPRERRVIELRFGLDDEQSRTLAEIGTELDLSKERIRQIEKEALTKLRHPSHSRKLIGYLG